jgi:hypothetical protein
MKKLTTLLGMLLITASSVHAGGIVSTHSSSVQLTVDAARSTAIRIGNSYSSAGSGVNTTDGTTAGSVGGLGTISSGIAAPATITATQATDGDAYSFSQTYTQGDALITSGPTTGDTPAYGNITSYTAGTAGSLAGTLDNAHTMTLTAGGAGTTATGQFITEITVID